MKNVMKLTLALVMVLGSTSLFAQKFGRIDTQAVIMSMPETEVMKKDMEAYAKDLQDNLESISVEFNTRLQEFQKNYETYSDAVRDLKQKELQELQNRAREFEQVAQQEIQKKQAELAAPIYEKAKKAIDKVAAAGGYMAVFDITTGSLAYFDEATLTDIAPEVKKELGITETASEAKK